MRLLVEYLARLGALALPPRCCGCGEPVAADHQFCASCWQQLRFLTPPWCAACNLPFDYDRGEEACCARCIASPPHHAGIGAAVAYGETARRLALKLKYGGRIGVAETMARLIARQVPDGVDLLVPVPLHRWRLWSRGYNQAALIAGALGRRLGIGEDRTALVRVRRTPVLRGLGPRARAKAVAGAFRVADPASVKDRHIGLVDDVLTSGATAQACARVLMRAGAASVTILCWARVLPGDGY
jgi:ComF family protein